MTQGKEASVLMKQHNCSADLLPCHLDFVGNKVKSHVVNPQKGEIQGRPRILKEEALWD